MPPTQKKMITPATTAPDSKMAARFAWVPRVGDGKCPRRAQRPGLEVGRGTLRHGWLANGHPQRSDTLEMPGGYEKTLPRRRCLHEATSKRPARARRFGLDWRP